MIKSIYELLIHHYFLDHDTVLHELRVANLSKLIAMNFSEDEDFVNNVFFASLVHDIGKVFIPSSILSKKGLLLDGEKRIVQKHCLYAYDLLKLLAFEDVVRIIVLQHHERLDGSGYPLGLLSDSILLESKILAVVDVFDAMASFRPYRAPLDFDLVFSYLDSPLFDNDIFSCLKDIISVDSSYYCPMAIS